MKFKSTVIKGSLNLLRGNRALRNNFYSAVFKLLKFCILVQMAEKTTTLEFDNIFSEDLLIFKA